MAYKFDLVSPERLLISEEVESIVIPGTEGEMTVMANHAPVMATIKPGVVIVKPLSGAEQRYVVFGGFADILPNVCTVLAEAALPAAEVTKDDLARRIEAAKADLADVKHDEERTKLEEFLSHLATLHDAV
ncbi:MAG: F0F1 ATP synthase subunit epsilon [Mesorhizobium sp.]